MVFVMKAEEYSTNGEKSVLRWGGLAGILSGIAFIFTIGILIGWVGAAPATVEQLVSRYPDIRFATAVGQVTYLVALLFLVPLIFAMYRALRKSSLAPALFGTGLSFLGIVVYATGALSVIALSKISDLYHAAGATSTQQATAVLLWQGIQGVFNETDSVGFAFFLIGMIVLGVAMLKTPTFGKVFGAISVVIGLIGVIGLAVISIDSGAFAIFAILGFIVYPVILGWKVYSLSRANKET